KRAVRALGATSPLALASGVSYTFRPRSPRRVKRDLPDVKLLIMLRDPVERAFSAHAYSVAAHCETATFERGLELEEGRLAGEVARIVADPTHHSLSHRHHSYRLRGQSIEQRERPAQ